MVIIEKVVIVQLSDAKIIEDKLKDQLDVVHKECFKRVNNTVS